MKIIRSRWLLIAFIVIVVLVLVWLVLIPLGSGDASKNRKIAEDLLRFHYRRWATEPILLRDLTNLPFQDEILPTFVATSSITIRRSYGKHLQESYWIENSTTNSSEWTLYHHWTWNGDRLTGGKLLTIVETNTPSH